MAVAPRWTAKAQAFLLAGFLSSAIFSPTLATADMAEAQAAIASGDYAAATRALRPLAENGQASAQYQLAKLALDGRDVGLKPDQAMSLLIQAAAQGNGPAQARLGLAYAKGEHVAQNDLAAFQWLSRASVAPDLDDVERSVVKTNRSIILGRLAPAIAAGADLDHPAPLPAPVPAKPLPSNSIAAVPLFSEAAPPEKPQAEETSELAVTAERSAPATMPAKQKHASPAGSYRLQIASLPDAASAANERERLLDRYSGLLGGLDLQVLTVTVANKGIRYRIVAGPFGDKPAAQQRCKQLKEAGQDCLIAIVAASTQPERAQAQ